jgi:hypothetical protein
MHGTVAKIGPSFEAKTTLPLIPPIGSRCGSNPRLCIYVNACQEEIVDDVGREDEV